MATPFERGTLWALMLACVLVLVGIYAGFPVALICATAALGSYLGCTWLYAWWIRHKNGRRNKH
jgi:hypothetical protein